jgi:hypothetical protein
MIGADFVGVLDLDIKSSDPKHLRAARQALQKYAPSVNAEKPDVYTGRGMGSAHYYFRSVTRIENKVIARSEDLVKVKFSGVAPSQRDLTGLSDDEISGGYRLRPAWEVMVMGGGRQCVVPPSKHPDTGFAYRWRNGGLKVDQLPVIEQATAPAAKLPTAVRRHAEYNPRPTGSCPAWVRDAIDDGAGVSDDRSAAVFTVVIELVRWGWSDEDICGMLTQRGTHLGDCAFEHAKTEDRAEAAYWVRKYSLVKARQEYGAEAAFESAVEYSRLSPDAAKEQEKEILGEWRDSIETDRHGLVKPRFQNLLTIIRHALGYNPFLYDVFAAEEQLGVTCRFGVSGSLVDDTVILAVKQWLCTRFGFSSDPATGIIHEAVSVIAAEQPINPLTAYLESLVWDGRPRIRTWMRDYCEAQAEEPYLSDISEKFLISMVARAFRPGCKLDTVLILVGEQGAGKSTTLSTLAGREDWFSDTGINFREKDAALQLRGKWIYELSELVGAYKSDTENIKQFISSRVDKIRPPYGRRVTKYPRHGVLAGSTNRSEFLNDTTGNRRFWPVEVGHCDTDGLAAVRDQLFAEAIEAWRWGAVPYLTDAAVIAQANEATKARQLDDPWVDEIRARLGETFADGTTLGDFLAGDFRVGDLLRRLGEPATDRRKQMEICEALRQMGYEKRHSRYGTTWSKK